MNSFQCWKLLAQNGLYIVNILKLFSVIIMVTPVNTVAAGKSREDEELAYARECLAITSTPKAIIRRILAIYENCFL